MKSFLIVLKFELETIMRKKSFVISTLVVALCALVGLSLPKFFNHEDSGSDKKNDKLKTMLVVDGQTYVEDKTILKQSLPDYEIRFTDDVATMRKAVKEGKADAGFKVQSPTKFVYYVKDSSMNDVTAKNISLALQTQYQQKELAKLHYDIAKVAAIYKTPVKYDTQVLGTDGVSNYFYTYVLILVLYMMILLYGAQIGVGVASEKSNRAVEILTTICPPNALIFGKVIAGAIAGVVQTTIMIGSFLLAYQLNAASWNHMLDKFLNIPSLVLVTFALFGILGYLLFSFLFGAIGAMCSKVEEVNGATMPIQLFIVAVFIVSFLSLQSPDTLFAKVLCYLPFTSWMCMFINVAMGSVTLVEIIISLVLLAVTTGLIGIAGARLYRRATLSYGNSVKLSNLFKMLKKKA